MATRPQVDYNALTALGLLVMKAAQNVAVGDPDELIVPMNACPVLPGEQDEDDVRAIASIDVLRYLVEHYESVSSTNDSSPWPTTDRERVKYADWQGEVGDGNTHLGFRAWLAWLDQSDQD